jgi:DNA-binding CsgD family transcriptional regulator
MKTSNTAAPVNETRLYGIDVEHELELRSRDLVERVKELDCLFSIAQIFSDDRLPLPRMLEEVVRVIPSACQYPEYACARITANEFEIASDNYANTVDRIEEPLVSEGEEIGTVEVGYTQRFGARGEELFLESERKLIHAVSGFLANKITQKQAENALKQTMRELAAQKVKLEQKNIALREILEQVEIEKREIKSQVASNIDQLIMPILRKIRDTGVPELLRRKYLEIVEQNLKDLASTYSKKIVSDKVRLSPREIEISMMVRDGFSSKEIAEQLHISELTVERHRHNIRKKFGISAEKINLSTFLRQM